MLKSSSGSTEPRLPTRETASHENVGVSRYDHFVTGPPPGPQDERAPPVRCRPRRNAVPQ